jgi:hypothetical protein
VLPGKLTKRDLTRAVLSTHRPLQRHGLILLHECLAAVGRVVRLAEAQHAQTMNHPHAQGANHPGGPGAGEGGEGPKVLRMAAVQRLPDLQTLLALKARLDPAAVRYRRVSLFWHPNDSVLYTSFMPE